MLVFAILCDAKVARARMIVVGNVLKKLWKFSDVNLLNIGFLVYLIGYVLFTLIVNGKIFRCSGNEQSCDGTTTIDCEKCASVVLISLALTYVIIFICNVSKALTLQFPLQRHRGRSRSNTRIKTNVTVY